MKVLKTKSVVASALMLSMMGAGCATPGKRTAVGAGAGAIVGAGAGALIGKGWSGAAVGAAAGAVAGGAVGNYLDKQAQELEKVGADGAHARGRHPGEDAGADLLLRHQQRHPHPQAVDEVTKVADVLVKYPENRIQVSGHTDSTGSDDVQQGVVARARGRGGPGAVGPRRAAGRQAATAGAGELQPVARQHTPRAAAKTAACSCTSTCRRRTSRRWRKDGNERS